METPDGRKRTRLRSGLAYVCWIGSAIVLAIAIAWLGLYLFREPSPPIDAANGAYANACCGTVTLHDGELILEGGKARYTLDQDSIGPYVLPDSSVGIMDGHGLRIDKGQPPRKLRLDSATRPMAIQIDDTARLMAHVFVRQSPKR